MKLLVPLAEQAKKLIGLHRNQESYKEEHTEKAKVWESRISQVNVPHTFKWLLRRWLLSKAVPSTSSKMNGTLATDAASERQPQLAGPLGSPLPCPCAGPSRSPPGQTRWQRRTFLPSWNKHIILTRPQLLHPIPNLSKICLFFLVCRTSEKLFSSFCLSQGSEPKNFI